jgi:hypothetical protein
MNPDDNSEPDFAVLLDCAEAKFAKWYQKVLRPDRDQRIRDLKKQNLTSGGRAVRAFEIYEDTLNREVRKKIGCYAKVARKWRSAEMLSKPRIDHLRKQIMTSVGAATGSLKGHIERDSRAAGDGTAPPNAQRYAQLEAQILTIVNAELRVLEAEGSLPSRAEVIAPEPTQRIAQNSNNAASEHPQAGTTESAPAQNRRLPSTVTSEIAARRMEAYMTSNAIGQTEFAGSVGTTDRTLRAFRKTGKVRRNIFDAIARAMGTTREALLNPEKSTQ